MLRVKLIVWSVETDWSDSCKVSNQSWVGFDPSMVSQLEDCVLLVKLSQYVRSPFVVVNQFGVLYYHEME